MFRVYHACVKITSILEKKMIRIQPRVKFYTFTHNNVSGNNAVQYYINHNMGALVKHAKVVRTTGGTWYGGGDANIPGYPQRWFVSSPGDQHGWLITRNGPDVALLTFHNGDDSVGVSHTYEVTLEF
jgi:hypothetical protein